jgi:hypothetical protein
MSGSTLPVLSHPSFPQVFEAAIRRFSDVQQFGLCDYATEFGSCPHVATVHHLESEQEFCAGHFRKVVAQ